MIHQSPINILSTVINDDELVSDLLNTSYNNDNSTEFIEESKSNEIINGNTKRRHSDAFPFKRSMTDKKLYRNISKTEYNSKTETPKNEGKLDENEVDFLRIYIQREKRERDSPEIRNICKDIQKGCMLREKYVYVNNTNQFPTCLLNDDDVCLNVNIVRNALPKKSEHYFKMVHGLFYVFNNNNNDKPLFKIHSFGEYMKDLYQLMQLITDGPTKSFCYQRLKTIEAKYRLHCLLNEGNELSEVKKVSHRDFYNVRKVDTHIHHSACMTQKHLLRFIKSKLKKEPKTIVYNDKTLKELFEELNLSPYDLNIDQLGMNAQDSFHRFDRFNSKYNPIGVPALRSVFLKTDNVIKGVMLY